MACSVLHNIAIRARLPAPDMLQEDPDHPEVSEGDIDGAGVREEMPLFVITTHKLLPKSFISSACIS